MNLQFIIIIIKYFSMATNKQTNKQTKKAQNYLIFRIDKCYK